jgi:sugar phosphate isomerase/epimerase
MTSDAITVAGRPLALSSLMWSHQPLEAALGRARLLRVFAVDVGARRTRHHLNLNDPARLDDEIQQVGDALGADFEAVAVSADHPDLSRPESGGRQEAIRYSARAIQAAVGLGAPVVSTSLGSVAEGGDWEAHAEAAAEALRAVAEEAEANGAVVAVQLDMGDVANSVDRLRQILDAVDSVAVGAAFDTGALGHLKIDLEQAFGAFGDRLHHVHLRDGDANTHLAIPGRGELDFAAFFRHLGEAGYEGVLSLELLETKERFGIDISDAARQAIEFLRAL